MPHGANRVLALMGVAYFLFLLLPSLSPHYGFYSDELYYLACADRLAFGYVDHPPFFVWVLRLHREIFGDSLVALRALPVAAGTATALMAGAMARRMGGATFAQALATLAVMMGAGSIAIFSMFTVNCLGILLWTAASWILLELLLRRDPRLWLALGIVLGLAFLNKHTAVVPVAGVAVAVLLSPLRRDLLGRWPWLGGLAFLVLISPNLGWQIANGWPSLAFYSGVEGDRLSASPLDQLAAQIVYNNPAAFPVWAGGLWFFFASARGRAYRPLGWLFVTAALLATIGGSRLPYRMAGVYPAGFAGGAVLLEALRKPDAGALRRLWNTWTLPALILAIGLASSTILLPIQRPEVLAQNPLYDAEAGSGWRPEIGTNEIPYHLGNRTHWKAFVAKVAEVWAGLDPDERADAILLLDYFGHAGALEYYGRGLGLPPVYSRMTGYFLWGPPPGSPQTVLSVGIDEAFLRANFERVEVAAVFECRYCPPVVDDLPIHVARFPRRPLAELWPEIGALDDRRTRMLRAQP